MQNSYLTAISPTNQTLKHIKHLMAIFRFESFFTCANFFFFFSFQESECLWKYVQILFKIQLLMKLLVRILNYVIHMNDKIKQKVKD